MCSPAAVRPSVRDLPPVPLREEGEFQTPTAVGSTRRRSSARSDQFAISAASVRCNSIKKHRIRTASSATQQRRSDAKQAWNLTRKRRLGHLSGTHVRWDPFLGRAALQE